MIALTEAAFVEFLEAGMQGKVRQQLYLCKRCGALVHGANDHGCTGITLERQYRAAQLRVYMEDL